MATVCKRGNSWYANYSIAGRQYRKSLGPISEAEARTRLAQMLIKAQAGAEPPTLNMDFLFERCRYLLTQTRKNAAKKQIPFALTKDDLRALVEESGGYCTLSGLQFEFAKLGGRQWRPFAPSIDRMDNVKGYTLENCRLVCCIVNVTLGQWGLGPVTKMIQSWSTFIPKPRVFEWEAARRDNVLEP